jgi:hypothetical protein
MESAGAWNDDLGGCDRDGKLQLLEPSDRLVREAFRVVRVGVKTCAATGVPTTMFSLRIVIWEFLIRPGTSSRGQTARGEGWAGPLRRLNAG